MPPNPLSKKQNRAGKGWPVIIDACILHERSSDTLLNNSTHDGRAARRNGLGRRFSSTPCVVELRPVFNHSLDPSQGPRSKFQDHKLCLCAVFVLPMMILGAPEAEAFIEARITQHHHPAGADPMTFPQAMPDQLRTDTLLLKCRRHAHRGKSQAAVRRGRSG